MINKYKLINDICLKSWSRLVNNSRTASFFQTKSCYDFYASIDEVEPFVYAVGNKECLKGLIVGYLTKDQNFIKNFFSRRAIIIGGPLLSDDITNNELAELLSFCSNDLKKKSIYIESRNFTDYSQYLEVFEGNGFAYHKHLNFHIDTSSIDIVKSNLGKSRKRDIRTSLRDGAKIVNNPTIEQVYDFYLILKDLYFTKIKTPLFSFNFFKKLFLIEESRFFLIELNEEIIGGTVCVELPDKVLYEWFACGKDGLYKNIHPSTLATYSGIEYSATSNVSVFDMMGAGKPDEGYGVRDFKAKFGGQLVENGRYINICKPFLFNLGEMVISFMKK